MLEAAWLIGCDGTHSIACTRMGLTFEEDALHAEFILVDVHIAELAAPPDESAIFWHPVRA